MTETIRSNRYTLTIYDEENEMTPGDGTETLDADAVCEGYEKTCKGIRTSLGVLEKNLRDLMKHDKLALSESYLDQHGEMKAQTMLAVRHIEDARMRVGKMLQYADDGVSILDKPPITGLHDDNACNPA